jgi:hypothetical protein
MTNDIKRTIISSHGLDGRDRGIIARRCQCRGAVNDTVSIVNDHVGTRTL